MTRYFLRLILIPIALFTAILVLIHAQPYDDHELRELLLPEGCPAPCFMGIKPGVTTMDEAVKILEARGWVKNIKQLKKPSGEIDRINWELNDIAPNMLKRNIKNYLQPPYSVTSIPSPVEIIKIETNILVGEIYLSFGESYNTDSGAAGYRTEPEPMASVLAQYREHSLYISSFVYCPVTKAKVLFSIPLSLG